MADYNDAIDDVAKIIDPGEMPCDCAYRDDNTGPWLFDCNCRNSGDLVRVASWCSDKNTVERIAMLKRDTAQPLSTEIPMDDCAVFINCGQDGTWLHFSAADGKSASLNMDQLEKGGLIGAALRSWCADRQKQAEQIRTAQR